MRGCNSIDGIVTVSSALSVHLCVCMQTKDVLSCARIHRKLFQKLLAKPRVVVYELGKVVSIMFYTFIRTYGLRSGFVEIFRRCRRVQHQLRMQWMNMEMRKNCFATNETLQLLWAKEIQTRVAGNSQGDPCLFGNFPNCFRTINEQMRFCFHKQSIAISWTWSSSTSPFIEPE